MAIFEVLIKGRDSGAKSSFQSVDRSAKKAEKSVKQLANRLKSTGDRIQTLGKNMKALTLPIIGAGVASSKMAIDFDRNMTKIQTLVGIAKDQVDAMRGSVIELSRKTGQSANEMSRGLFVITSAGLRGQDALDALELSAKASAAGLGEIDDIARAVAGTMNAYGSETVSAARAIDAITAAARAGNFETSQLAGALGRVLPFAKQAGASIEDTAAAVALLTRTNGDAAQSVTQVGGLLRAFATPTAQTSKALKDAGTSAAEMRERIGKDGLVAALKFLDERLDGNREKLGLLIGRAEGTSAAMQTLDADAATLEATFGEVAKSAGITENAFNLWGQSMSGQFTKAIEGVKLNLLDLAETSTPLLEDLAENIGNLSEKFAGMSESQKRNTVQTGLWTVAISGLLIVAGKLIVAISAIVKMFGALKAAAIAASIGAGVVLAAIAGLVVAAGLLISTWDTVIDFYAKGWQKIFDLFKIFSVSLIVGLVAFANKIKNTFVSLWDFVKTGFANAFDYVASVVNSVIGRIQTAIAWLNKLNAVRGAKNLVRKVVDTVSGGDAPVLHSGGIYRAPQVGGAGLAMLRDGERVVTPEQDREGANEGNTVNINQQGLFAGANISIASREDARAISEEIYGITRSRLRAQGAYA